MHVTNFLSLFFHLQARTYVKTKKREVEPTRRQAAVHTGMKALGFRESAPLAGILSSPTSPESHHGGQRRRTRRAKCLFVGVSVRKKPRIHLWALEDENHSPKNKTKRRDEDKSRRHQQQQQQQRVCSLLQPVLCVPAAGSRQHRTDAASGFIPKVELFTHESRESL